MSGKRLLSVVVPCYNEELCVEALHVAVSAVMAPLAERVEVEFRFVDDGSRDGTLAKLRELRGRDGRVHYLSLSRNFGKEAALLAGLESARGDYVVVMDADLQDPPGCLPTMFEALESGGYDCVATRRSTRAGEAWLRSVFARLFYWLMRRLTRVDLMDGARDFRMMNRAFLRSLLSLTEVNRFSKGLFGWVGYRVKWLSFENVERSGGTTKWSFWGLSRYALDGIVAFSTVPLHLSFLAGTLACLLAAALCVKTLIQTIFFNEPVQGYTTLLVSITFFSGIQFLLTGVLGLYLSKIYLEVKRRPVYLVREEA